MNMNESARANGKHEPAASAANYEFFEAIEQGRRTSSDYSAERLAARVSI